MLFICCFHFISICFSFKLNYNLPEAWAPGFFCVCVGHLPGPLGTCSGHSRPSRNISPGLIAVDLVAFLISELYIVKVKHTTFFPPE